MRSRAVAGFSVLMLCFNCAETASCFVSRRGARSLTTWRQTMVSILPITTSESCSVAYRATVRRRIVQVGDGKPRGRMLPAALHMSTDADSPVTTLASGSHVAEMEVKKSRFIGYAQHVETWKKAQDYLETIHMEHPKARHVCFGFVAGSNPVQERCSDDGEPTGTAGLPILGAVKGEGLSDTICVIVRYFGGTKLGAGGLIRAYGGAARLVLRDAPKEVLIPKTSFRVSVTSSYAGSVYDSVAKAGGDTSEEEYTQDGTLVITVTCETERLDVLKANLQDSTRGSVEYI